MSGERPTINPGYLAELVEAAPSRVRKKVDADPGAANAWDWSQTDTTLTVSDTETVTATIIDGEVQELSCTCLLSPRCLHTLRVASLLPLTEHKDLDVDEPVGEATDSDSGHADAGAADEAAPAGEAQVALDDRARALAIEAWDRSCGVLATGVSAVDSLRLADLARTAHLARAAGLYRLDAALVRVIDGIRSQRSGDAEFSLAAYTANLTELLTVARLLGGHRNNSDNPIGDNSIGTDNGPAPTVTPDAIGIGRRAYRDVGSMTLYGLFTEAVATASGYAGVVTYLADADGKIWTVSDIRPGEADRCRQAYRGATGITTASHRELGRSKVFLQNATASASGRLGAGKQVQAVVSGTRSWNDPELDRLWQTPLAEQLVRALSPSQTVEVEGDNLLFAQGQLAGSANTTTGHRIVLLQSDQGTFALAAPEGLARFEFDENLRLLHEAEGQEVRIIARPQPNRPRFMTLLALASTDPRTERWPESWTQRINLAFEALRPEHVRVSTADREHPGITPETAEPSGPAIAAPTIDQPLRPLGALVERTAMTGRQALASGATRSLRIETTRLQRDLWATGALLVEELAAAGVERSTTGLGARIPPPPDRLATAWLAAATYHRHAEAALERASWGLS